MMKKKSVFLGLMVAALCGVLAMSACAGVGSTSGTWRYRMTVTVATPEGDKVGSAVREVSVRRGWQPLPESQPEVRLKGEAVVVDLGKRGVVFALLGYNYASDLPGYVFLPDQGWLSPQGIERLSTLKAGPVALEANFYPRFVHFRNINDPMTVENISRYKKVGSVNVFNNELFEKSFGVGTKLKSVTIEMTKAPVTWQIDKVLPWLAGVKGAYLNGGHSSREAPLGLSAGEFQMGDK